MLAIIMVCTLMPVFTATAEDAPTYAVGDLIEYGTYPQTRVNETEALAAAAETALWCSYNYYFRGESENLENPSWYPYSYNHGDWMQFADFFCGGEKYRAVRFTQYRADQTTSEPVAEYSQQDDNGYYTDTTYYFRYEPLTWRVLDPAEGLIMCVSAIDAQPFHRTCCRKIHLTLFYQYRGEEHIPVCDYTQSSLRDWLNTDFFRTAFTDGQKDNLQVTHRDESTATGDLCNEFSNRVFLLSVAEVTNDAYGFSSDASVADPAKEASPTDYAMAQGYVSSNGWWLRSSEKRFDFNSVRNVFDGKPDKIDIDRAPLGGVRPVCRLSALMNDAAISDTLYSAAHEHMPDETVYENETEPTCTEIGTRDEVVYCVYCNYEFSRTQTSIPALGHKFTNYQEVAPTCTLNGHTAYIFCTRCGSYDSAPPEILPALGHSFTSVITTAPTCTEAGERTYTCERCPEIYTEEEPALGHGSMGYDVSSAPSTCTVRGYSMTVCIACGEIVDSQTYDIDPKNHRWGEWEVVLQATEEEEGLMRRTCLNDPEHVEERIIPRYEEDENGNPTQKIQEFIEHIESYIKGVIDWILRLFNFFGKK